MTDWNTATTLCSPIEHSVSINIMSDKGNDIQAEIKGGSVEEVEKLLKLANEFASNLNLLSMGKVFIAASDATNAGESGLK